MTRDLAALTGTEFDLVVIGGGIVGACAAWDAAQRGLSVALIERGDFGSATSANLFKMVHGGIRYVQHADLPRVRQSSQERRVLLRIAPHLVGPLPIVVPTYGHGLKGKAALRVGMGAYDALTFDRNRGIDDPARRIPRGRCISRDEVLRAFPGLDQRGLTGAGIIHDGQIFNPPRLVLAFLQRAAGAGAVAANYVEATGLLPAEGRPRGVRARDHLTGSELEIRAKVVLNAAGPYAERFLTRAGGLRLDPAGTYSRDACFVVPRRLFGGDYALALQGRTSDPDARFSRGARHLFVVPWREYSLVGVWHVVYRGDPDAFTVTEADLQGFVAEVNAAYPPLGLTMDDVGLWNAGLVPFGDNPEGATNLRYGHRSRLVDHAGPDGIDNLITLIGVRFTTGRDDAERAVDLVCRKLGRRTPASRTHMLPVQGGDIASFDDLLGDTVARHSARLPAAVVRSLVHNYGSDCERVIRHVDDDASMAESLGDSPSIKAQIRHAARAEMAQTLGDVVFRRTDLATGRFPGLPALAAAARVLGAELGWHPGRAEQEIDEVVRRFPRPVRGGQDDALTGGATG